MTEITRVPIQPVAKGSLARLWLGVAAAIALGAGVAWAALPRGVDVEVLAEGTGEEPKLGDVVFVNYVGRLKDGTEFDRSQPLPIPPGLFPEGNPLLLEEGALVDGFVEGLQRMKKGGKYRLEIPAAQAYGEAPPQGSNIPPNSDLIFEVEVVDFMSREDFQRRAAALEQMMQQMQQGQGQAPGQPGAPGAPAEPAPAAPPQ